jgi:hypothetical protein
MFSPTGIGFGDSIIDLQILNYLQESTQRDDKETFTRLEWLEHVEQQVRRRRWNGKYHMSPEAFAMLVDLLRPMLEVDPIRLGSHEPILPEIVVAIGVRYLGGSRMTEFDETLRVSYQSAWRLADKFFDAVLQCEALSFELPTSQQGLQNCANGFDSISSAESIFFGVVGAIDGWLCCIDKPSDVSNPSDYYSGHYRRYGLNVQAMVDSSFRFQYVKVAGPGRRNDAKCFKMCTPLQKWLAQLPSPYCIVGDNAYPLRNNLLIPYSGRQRNANFHRVYNFYLSQQRIRVEMAFARLTTKWRIFRRNLDLRLPKCSQIIAVACRLHNFVIDQDGPEGFVVEPLPVGGGENTPIVNNGYLPIPTPIMDELPQCIQPNSARRDQILQLVEQYALVRPIDNVRRQMEQESAEWQEVIVEHNYEDDY